MNTLFPCDTSLKRLPVFIFCAAEQGANLSTYAVVHSATQARHPTQASYVYDFTFPSMIRERKVRYAGIWYKRCIWGRGG